MVLESQLPRKIVNLPPHRPNHTHFPLSNPRPERFTGVILLLPLALFAAFTLPAPRQHSRLVGWLVGWLVGLLFIWLVGWLVGWSVG